MAEFNPQQGATQGGAFQPGWTQSKAIQAGIGSGMQAAIMKEKKGQWEEQMATSREQFDTRLAAEKKQHRQTLSFQKNQADVQAKKEERAQSVGMFGLGLQTFQLWNSLENSETLQAADVEGGGPTTDPNSTAGYKSGETGGPGAETTTGDTSGQDVGGGTMGDFNWGGMVMGGAGGGMMGAGMSQAMFGEGKTQGTVGGAIGGAAGGYAGTGSGWGALGGAVIGALIGYYM